jgi:hypothetical protein
VVSLVGGMVGAIGSMWMEVEPHVAEAFVFHALINHAPIITWSWGCQGDFPEFGRGVADAAEHKAVGRCHSDLFGGEGSGTAMVAELSYG